MLVVSKQVRNSFTVSALKAGAVCEIFPVHHKGAKMATVGCNAKQDLKFRQSVHLFHKQMCSYVVLARFRGVLLKKG